MHLFVVVTKIIITASRVAIITIPLAKLLGVMSAEL